MASKTTQRSLKLLREDGYECAIVERWNAFAHIRQDLFGFIDILCLCPYRGILGVQTTVAGKIKERKKKIGAEPRSRMFLKAGGAIVIHGWKKATRNDNARRGTWICVKEIVV
jgi:hypothetical protein